MNQQILQVITDETKICFGLATKQNNATAKAVRRINTQLPILLQESEETNYGITE